ncbi:hypothetical protein B0H16DRAFT_1455038 [Mycena metata]|uniref:Uncharacterized protein n=1 Tax=Mycena metata TaxID=1033252 RepID=A0AAD7JHY1_9AGAR|nr:hypothetical protein B0H16DRAFT_1455038 [Mycena metata]
MAVENPERPKRPELRKGHSKAMSKDIQRQNRKGQALVRRVMLQAAYSLLAPIFILVESACSLVVASTWKSPPPSRPLLAPRKTFDLTGLPHRSCYAPPPSFRRLLAVPSSWKRWICVQNLRLFSTEDIDYCHENFDSVAPTLLACYVARTHPWVTTELPSAASHQRAIQVCDAEDVGRVYARALAAASYTAVFSCQCDCSLLGTRRRNAWSQRKILNDCSCTQQNSHPIPPARVERASRVFEETREKSIYARYPVQPAASSSDHLLLVLSQKSTDATALPSRTKVSKVSQKSSLERRDRTNLSLSRNMAEETTARSEFIHSAVQSYRLLQDIRNMAVCVDWKHLNEAVTGDRI